MIIQNSKCLSMKCWIAAMSYGVENDLMSVPEIIIIDSLYIERKE